MTTVLRHHHRPAPAPTRGPEQRGTALVQVALVIPLFVLFLLGLVDIGLGVFQTSQATSAAADGARAGIVAYKYADVAGSVDQQKILAAVRARAVGQTASTMTVRITCVDGTGTLLADGCSNAGEDDRVKVVVTWPFRPISPVGRALAGGTVSGTATMAIVLQPTDIGPTTSTTAPTTTTTSTSTTSTTTQPTTTTTAPPTCVVQTVTATPSTVSVNGAGKTSQAVQLVVTTNGSPACFGLALTVDGGVGVGLATADGVTFVGTIPKNTVLGSTPGPRMGTFNLAPGPWLVVTVS